MFFLASPGFYVTLWVEGDGVMTIKSEWILHRKRFSFTHSSRWMKIWNFRTNTTLTPSNLSIAKLEDVHNLFVMKVKFDTFFQGSLQYSFKIAPFFRLSDIDINLSKNRRRSKHIRKPSLCLAAVSNPDVDGLSEVSVPTAGEGSRGFLISGAQLLPRADATTIGMEMLLQFHSCLTGNGFWSLLLGSMLLLL